MNNIEFITLLSNILTSKLLAPSNIKLLKLDDEMPNRFDIDFVAKDAAGKELPKRGLTVRNDNRGWSVSHGIHSPSQVEADNIQLIVVGEVAKKLMKINAKKLGKTK